MRITVPSWRAPRCKCGNPSEIYVDVYNLTLRVKCHYCGYEKSIVIPYGADSLTLRNISNIAESLIVKE